MNRFNLPPNCILMLLLCCRKCLQVNTRSFLNIKSQMCYNIFFFLCQPSSFSTLVFLCVKSLQALGWSSCWFSVGSSFPGPALVTASATPHRAPSPAKPTTSSPFQTGYLLTASASSYRTTRSIAYKGATSVPTLSSSGSTPTTSPTSNHQPSTASHYWRSWTWETTATCALWQRTPFMV